MDRCREAPVDAPVMFVRLSVWGVPARRHFGCGQLVGVLTAYLP
jgi:hypothetical protein